MEMKNNECMKEDVIADMDEDMSEDYRGTFHMALNRGTSRLEKLGEEMIIPANHVFIEAGQIPKYCYVVKKGRVISYEKPVKEEERIYHFYEANGVFLESDLIYERPTQVSYRAVSNCEVVRINRVSLMKAIFTDAEVAMDVMEAISSKLHSVTRQIVQIRGRNANWKTCEFFLAIAEQYGVDVDGKIVIEEKFSQQTIASVLGVNRITVVRAMKELKEKGLLEHCHGSYRILDIDGLKEYQSSIAGVETV